MKKHRAFSAVVVIVLLLSLVAAGGGSVLAAMGTAFTYQGRLLDDSNPANGTYDFRFSLWDDASAGSQVGSLVSKDDESLTDGLFTVTLDFGSGAFDGGARWLRIEVKRDADGTYNILSPRVPLTPAPNALALPGLWTQQVAGSHNIIGGYTANSVTAGAGGAVIGGGGASGYLNRVSDDAGVVGGGLANQAGDDAGTTDDAVCATVSGGHNNTASGTISTVGGGDGNTASGQWATVGGGYDNTASGLYAATVPGGRGNRVTDSSGVVGGGESNQAGDDAGTTDDATHATVGGGHGNIASGTLSTVGGGSLNDASSSFDTIGGGSSNATSGSNSTVGGGTGNNASGSRATIGGGDSNIAGAYAATVPGGQSNTAQGDYSLAAGRRAQANHAGTFVWGDNTDADFASTAVGQFLVRATGGVWFGTTSSPSFPANSFIATSTGAYLSTGGAWTDGSDRDLKENVAPVDGQEVLARLAGVPISTWNYKAQDPAVRHMGPMAQDFSAAFGLGEDDRHIASLDASGVALASIQALHAENQAQAARLDALEEENAGLRQQLDSLEARLSTLEAGSPAAGQSRSPLGGLQPGWLLGGLLAVGCVAVAGRHRRAKGGA